MHSLDFKVVIIKKGEIVEATPSKVILMMPKNQESSKFQRFKNEVFQESSFKNQDSRIIKIKIQDSTFKNQEKAQSR